MIDINKEIRFKSCERPSDNLLGKHSQNIQLLCKFEKQIKTTTTRKMIMRYIKH